MPRRALGLTGGIVHLAHLVHVDERIEVLQWDPAKARRTGILALETTGAVLMDTTSRGWPDRRRRAAGR